MGDSGKNIYSSKYILCGSEMRDSEDRMKKYKKASDTSNAALSA